MSFCSLFMRHQWAYANDRKYRRCQRCHTDQWWMGHHAGGDWVEAPAHMGWVS